MKKVIVITGPTGVGKTKISIELANFFHGEIINADASQMYKDLNVGTAKIKPEEMNNIKHHLIDFLDLHETFSIKEFQNIGRNIIDTCQLPFVVGGSGLYINALLYDYDLHNEARDSSKYQNYTNQELYELLLEKDPIKASQTHPNNRRRVERYLDLVLDGGLPKNDPIPKYDILNICLIKPREILYDDINKRCDMMFANGWIEECQRLKNENCDLSKLKEIGYSDIDKYLNNLIALPEAIDSIKQKTRRYAKRQMTWFRNKMDCVFVDITKHDIDYLKGTINTFLDKMN